MICTVTPSLSVTIIVSDQASRRFDSVLWCAVIWCAVLYCAALWRNVLHYIISLSFLRFPFPYYTSRLFSYSLSLISILFLNFLLLLFPLPYLYPFSQLSFSPIPYLYLSLSVLYISFSFTLLSYQDREKSARMHLAEQLRDLPEPEFTYEISVPEVWSCENLFLMLHSVFWIKC